MGTRGVERIDINGSGIGIGMGVYEDGDLSEVFCDISGGSVGVSLFVSTFFACAD